MINKILCDVFMAIIWFIIGVIVGAAEFSISINEHSINSSNIFISISQILLCCICGWRAGDYIKDVWSLRPWKKPVDIS